MNDIDRLMQTIEAINTKITESVDVITSEDVTTLIAYHRHNRQRLAFGEKPKRASAPTADLSDVMDRLRNKIVAPAPTSTPAIPFKPRKW